MTPDTANKAEAESSVRYRTKYRYDVFGKIRKATLAGNLPSAPFWAWRDGTDPAGQVRRFEYDGLGRLRKEQLPEESGTAVPQQTSPPVRTCTVSGGGNGPIGTTPVDPDDPDSGGDGTTRTPPQVTCTETPGAPLPDQWAEIDRQYFSYDAWGNLLAWQDALGAKRGYFFQNDYDVAGRITAAWRTIGAPGSPSAAVERMASATPDYGTISSASLFVVSGTGTTPSLWKPAALGQGNCPAAPPAGGTSAFATGLCAYSSVKGTADAVRYAVTGATRDDVLKFLHWRDVRAGSGSHDQFSVWVTLQTAGADVSNPRVLFTSSDAQPSFKAWIAAPPTRPGDVFTPDEWPEGAARDIYVYFVFKKGDTSATSGKGVVVTNVSLGRPSHELLASYGYDEDHCASGAAAAACSAGPGLTNAPLGRQTTVRSYEEGTATSVRRIVYRGLGGRPSASQEWLDWSGVPSAESTWPSWASATSYATSGAPNGWTAPHVAGTSGDAFAVDLARDYALRVRDASSGTTYAEARASGTASSPYDAAGLPRAIAFGNGVLQTIARDARHRPSEIVVQGPAGSVLWDTGTYAYDGAGMIAAIGEQRYAYDAAGRLVYAKVIPQAEKLPWADVETLGYDIFGNLRTRTVQPAAGRVAPVGEDMALDFDSSAAPDGSTNKNQVVRRAVLDNAGAQLKDANGQPLYAKDVSYDANGNATRFLGLLATSAGGFWDPQNRMTVFVQGDPQAAKATPAEQYRHDAGGMRWYRLDKSGLPRLTLRDGAGQALAEYTVSPASGGGGTIAAAKEYVPGFGGVVAERTWTASGWAATYHHRDHLGSLRLVTDPSGTVVEAHDYYPFGGEMGAVGASSRRKFTGHERDEETGLDYMLARYHSPGLGRFLSVDPGFDVQNENPQSWNLYAYVRNSPVNGTDPTGKWEWLDNLCRKIVNWLSPPKQVSVQEHKERDELMAAAGMGPEERRSLDGKIGGVGDGEKVAEGAREGHTRVGGAFAQEAITQLSFAAFMKGAGSLAELGRAGTGRGVREVVGTVDDAKALFDQLRGSNPVREVAEGVFVAEAEAGGGSVTFRAASKSGPPTVDVHGLAEGVRKVKFVTE